MTKGRISRRSALALAGAGLLSGCSGGIRPFRRRAAAPQAAPAVAAEAPAAFYAGIPIEADGTGLMPSVRFAAAESGHQGVILRAITVAPTLGFHSPELRPLGRGEDGIETVELRARPPVSPEAVGAERARLLTVGRFYPRRALRDVRGFRVVAAGNAVDAALPR